MSLIFENFDKYVENLRKSVPPSVVDFYLSKRDDFFDVVYGAVEWLCERFGYRCKAIFGSLPMDVYYEVRMISEDRVVLLFNIQRVDRSLLSIAYLCDVFRRGEHVSPRSVVYSVFRPLFFLFLLLLIDLSSDFVLARTLFSVFNAVSLVKERFGRYRSVRSFVRNVVRIVEDWAVDVSWNVLYRYYVESENVFGDIVSGISPAEVIDAVKRFCSCDASLFDKVVLSLANLMYSSDVIRRLCESAFRDMCRWVKRLGGVLSAVEVGDAHAESAKISVLVAVDSIYRGFCSESS